MRITYELSSLISFVPVLLGRLLHLLQQLVDLVQFRSKDHLDPSVLGFTVRAGIAGDGSIFPTPRCGQVLWDDGFVLPKDLYYASSPFC